MEWHGLPALGCDVQGLVITFGGTCGKSGARNPDKTRQIGVISQKRSKFLSEFGKSLEATIARFLIFQPMVPRTSCMFQYVC